MQRTVDPRDVRAPADWMRPIDDRLLELLRDEGNLTPRAVAEAGLTHRNYASNRYSLMTDAGLVERPFGAPGLYRITDEGRAYLDEELDASELPDPTADEDDGGDE